MVHKEGQVVYPEVEGLSILKGFKTSNAGCCKVRESGSADEGRGAGCLAAPVDRAAAFSFFSRAGVAAPPVGQRSVPGHALHDGAA